MRYRLGTFGNLLYQSWNQNMRGLLYFEPSSDFTLSQQLEQQNDTEYAVLVDANSLGHIEFSFQTLHPGAPKLYSMRVKRQDLQRMLTLDQKDHILCVQLYSQMTTEYQQLPKIAR